MIDESDLALELIEDLFFADVEPLVGGRVGRGPGCYLLLYRGRLKLYAPIAGRWPIYAGSTGSLADRMGRHRVNLRSVHDLAAHDFDVIALPTPSLHLAAYLESVAIESFRPVWNHRLLRGFGSQPQGRARSHQRRSAWSVLHPGRPCGTGAALRSRKQLKAIATDHLTHTAPPIGVSPFSI
jgi:hypothetical protein